MKVRMAPAALVAALMVFASCSKNNDNNNNTTVSSMDSSFTTAAANSNYAEISAGQLALTKSSDTGVLAFANKMIADHGDAQDSLQLIATQLHLNAPDAVNAEQAAVAAQLKLLSGRAFDSTYIYSEVDGHVKTISLLNDEADNGSNNSLKKYVSTYLPAIEMHQTMADSLATKYPK